jgi:hypothetical protein
MQFSVWYSATSIPKTIAESWWKECAAAVGDDRTPGEAADREDEVSLYRALTSGIRRRQKV